MGDVPITTAVFGQKIPDHFNSACFTIPFATSTEHGPSVISSTADKVSFLREAEFPSAGTDIAIFGNHNLAYYYWHLARTKGHLKGNAVLLHFDAHSDIKSSAPIQFPPDYRYPLDTFLQHAHWLTIANFIGDATFSGLIGEFDWVLPDWAPKGSLMGNYYWDHQYKTSSISSPDATIPFGHCINGGDFQTLPVRDMGECESIERIFMLKKSYLDSMPKISGQDVILDIDMDWFCNSGWDSGNLLLSGKTFCDKNAMMEVGRLLAALHTNNIKPSSVTISTAPEYMFTDNADDILYTLVKGLIEHGIVPDPNIIIEEPAYPMNIQYLARSLFNIVYDNMINDPRINGNGIFVSHFNSEEKICELTILDETKGYMHDRVENLNDETYYPGKDNAASVSFTYLRGDYSQYASIAKEYGLINLQRTLEHLEEVQADEGIDQGTLKNAYKMVLYLIHPMMNHLRDANQEPAVVY